MKQSVISVDKSTSEIFVDICSTFFVQQDPEMMMIATPDDDYYDDDGTEVGSDFSVETSSETACASSGQQDVDMDWIPKNNIKQVCYILLLNFNWVLQ